MNRLIAVGGAIVSLVATTAFAQAEKKEMKPASSAQGMDMSKMGPWTRKPTNEAKVRKEIQDFFKSEEDVWKAGDFNAHLTNIDFPYFMQTDDSKGMPHGKAYTREEYAQMMKPMMDNMPKDAKTTHKPTITVLSDSLVTVVDDFTMTVGKQKMTGKNAMVLVKRDGKWRAKMVVEAGWGDMEMATGGAGEQGSKKY